jgi:hypothetical protein
VDDCAGVCGGDAVLDECGDCNGDGIAEGECDCDGNVLDCADECGGSAVVDECDICDGDGSTCGDEITDGCDLPEDTVHLLSNGDVLFNVPTDIAGYQFDIEGTTATGASGGESAAAGFTLSAAGSTVLAFSFTGATVSTDCGLLTTLSLNGDAEGLSGLVFSDAAAQTIPVVYFDGGDTGGSIFFSATDDRRAFTFSLRL